MGRKKIEIRPLIDERNRNVTFLKRKAGLMKKAWELSVLCGADVSIIIFNAAGRAFEFSSKDLEPELDRYAEYEGLIERRRAEEFAAMAEAGEDDDDDDEDETTTKKKPGPKGKAGAVATPGGMEDKKPIKTLKGKEVYKQKQPSRREIVAAAQSRRKRDRGGERLPSQGFIDGLINTDSESSDGDRKREGSEMAGLNYAMSLGPNASAAHTLASFPSSLPPNPYSQPASYSRHSFQSSPPIKADNMPPNYSPAYSQHASSSAGINYPPNMGGLQWDPALLQRYAEFQMQQNHQRQHRLLLQRQREQLALMGVGMGAEGERRLLDDIFGAGGASGRGSGSGGGGGGGESGYSNHGGQGNGGGAESDAPFVWPTFNSSNQSHSNNNHNHHNNTEYQSQSQSQSHSQAFPSAQQQREYQDYPNNPPNHPNAQSQPLSHNSGSNSHDTSDVKSNPYYPADDSFEYNSTNTPHHSHQPTPGSVGTTAATPWYSNLGDMGPGGAEATPRNPDELPYNSPSAFEDLIGRKRVGEDVAGSGNENGKRIKV